MKKRIAIIPARGGSKRIPKKNIRNFFGKPMISYVLSAAKESKLFDKIHVSTESQEVVDVVSELGFDIDFMRPGNLSDDITSIMPVMKFVVNRYLSIGEEFDEVWLLMACAPFVKSDDFIAASALFDKHNGRLSVLSVAEYPVPIEWAFIKKPSDELCPVQEGMFLKRSQDIEKKYYDAGAFIAFPTSEILSVESNGSDQGFVGYVIPKSRAIDIDDEDDWLTAEGMASNILGREKNF